MKRPSFPTVISLIALFVALGGTSYAVIRLPARSVGNRELKSNAVTSGKIRPQSIARSDLSESARVGSRGPRGPAGPPGAAAPADAAKVEGWKALVLVGSWAHYGDDWPTPGYRKDGAGHVFLRGLVKRAGGLGPADTIAVLPSGYTPANRTMSTAAMNTGSGPVTSGRLDIEKDGQLRWSGGPAGDPNFVSLDNVSFWTE
jgi:hypothetical protein